MPSQTSFPNPTRSWTQEQLNFFSDVIATGTLLETNDENPAQSEADDSDQASVKRTFLISQIFKGRAPSDGKVVLRQLRGTSPNPLIPQEATQAEVPAREKGGYLLYLKKDERGGFQPTSGQGAASLSIRIISRDQRPLSRTPPHSPPLTVRF